MGILTQICNLEIYIRYQFQPGRINMTVALQVLLKALTNLPRTDFIMLKCVLPQDLVSFILCDAPYHCSKAITEVASLG